MAASQQTPSRTSKRHDTWEPVMVRCFDKNGPFNLSGSTPRFLAKTTINDVDSYIDSESALHGECFVVEDEGGVGSNPGANEDIEWPVGSGLTISVPENRGWVRYEQTELAVSVASIYEVEIEATLAGKTITFPNKEDNNPRWEISPDIEPTP